MQEKSKTKKQLLTELEKLHHRVNQLEKLETYWKQAEESLRENELYLKAIMASMQAGVMVIDADKHEIVDVNEKALELIGTTKTQIIGRTCHEYVCPAEKGKCPITDLKQVIDNSERTLIDIDGEKIPIIKTVVPVILRNRTYLLESFIDIKERKRTEESLKLDEERLEALLKLSRMDFNSEKEITDFALEEGVRLTRSTGGYLHFFDEEDQTIHLYSWSKEVVKTCTATPNHHYPLESAGVWADSIRLKQAVIHNDYQSLTERKGYPEGHFHLVRHLGIPIFDGSKIVGVTGVGNKEEPYNESDARQITLFMNSMWGILKRRRAEQEQARLVAELQALSIKDELTGLYNRRGIFSLVTQHYTIARRLQKTLMLLFIDLDGMKQINDLYGHHEGDSALIDTANILKRTFRDTDIIARIGGDEFAIFGMIMEDRSLNNVIARINEKLDVRLREYAKNSAKPYALSLSTGFAFADPQKPFSFEAMLSEADQNMYLQKQRKKDS